PLLGLAVLLLAGRGRERLFKPSRPALVPVPLSPTRRQDCPLGAQGRGNGRTSSPSPESGRPSERLCDRGRITDNSSGRGRCRAVGTSALALPWGDSRRRIDRSASARGW